MKCIVPISGGKDSQACMKLAVAEYGPDEVEGLFCDTGFEHPVTYQHVDRIAEMYGVRIHRVKAGDVPSLVKQYKRFPSGVARHCTYLLKIIPSKRFYAAFVEENGPFEVWYGMRAEESAARAKRYAGKVSDDIYPPHEVLANYPKYLYKKGVTFRLPIIEWAEQEVYDLLDGEENPLYVVGFDRVGCFPCLAAGDAHKEKAFFFDETGRKHFEIARSLEPVVGRSVFTSKGGQKRNDTFQGCAICAM